MSSEAPTEKNETAPLRRRFGCWRLLGIGFLVILAWLGIKAATWPDVARLAKENPSTTAFIDDYRAAQLADGESDAVAWRWVSYGKISPHLLRAALVAEDIDFFSHDGFAVDEIKLAIRATLEEGKSLRGASTISQQLAKNLWLSPSRNPLRKLEEALLTQQLETHLDKRRILEIYLNVVELGDGIYGAEAASQKYFGTSAASLTESQAAQLAAALPRPSSWHPGSQAKGYGKRVELILQRMRKAQFLRREI